MFTARLAPAQVLALAQEQVQVRLPAVAPEAQVVPRQWFEAAHRFAYLVPGPTSKQQLRKNLAADYIGRADFPFIVTNADVLDNRIAAIIDSVRDNAIPLIREAAVDLSDHFSVVVANLHFSSP
jgi:hypothetical protein